MFKKIKERLLTLEVVIDAVLSLLDKKGLVEKSEIQAEILVRAQEEEEDERE